MRTKDVLIRIGPSGAEVLGDEAISAAESDLVQTSAEEKVRKAVAAVTVSVREVSSVIFDVIDSLAEAAASRASRQDSKLTITFGVAGGANATLKLVGAKADAFITVQVEFPPVR